MRIKKTTQESGYYKEKKCVYCGIQCANIAHKIIESGYCCLQCFDMYKTPIKIEPKKMRRMHVFPNNNN